MPLLTSLAPGLLPRCAHKYFIEITTKRRQIEQYFESIGTHCKVISEPAFDCFLLLSTGQLNPNSLPRCAQRSCKCTSIFSGFALCLRLANLSDTKRVKSVNFRAFLVFLASLLVIRGKCQMQNIVNCKCTPTLLRLKVAMLSYGYMCNFWVGFLAVNISQHV